MVPVLDHEQVRRELIDTFQMDGMLPQDQDAVLEKIMEALFKTVLLKSLEKIGEPGVDELDDLPDDPQMVLEFFQSKIPNYRLFVREIFDNFKTDMLRSIS